MSARARGAALVELLAVLGLFVVFVAGQIRLLRECRQALAAQQRARIPYDGLASGEAR